MSAMGGTMVDTMVLVYAFDYENRHTQRSRREQRASDYRHEHTPARLEASAALVRSLDVIWASTITIVEFMRTIKEEEREWFDTLGTRIQPLDVTRSVADKAAILLRKRTEPTSDICPMCLNHADGPSCKRCNRRLSRHFAFADAAIVATAEVNGHISRLCSYDSGILDFGRYAKRCSVIEPPNPVGQIEIPGVR